MKFKISILSLFLILTGCVGPDYKKPEIQITPKYKESKDIIWKEATPNADIERGEWWKIFNDSVLDNLITQSNNHNMTNAAAAANFKQALAIIDVARGSWFPNLTSSYSTTTDKTNEQSTSQNRVQKDTSNHTASFSSSWELDVWGATKYSVKSDRATALSSKAALALQILSTQSSLAQYYFELRAVDIDQQLLDEIVIANQKTVKYTKHKFKAGTAQHSDVLTAESNLNTAIANSDNNKINRQQYEHAIAVLVGESPSSFSIKPIKNYKMKHMNIPLALPSELMERRPDIAQYEQLVKQANAQIGIATTAFFPSFSLVETFSMQGNTMGNLLNMPTFTWSLGPQMALTLFDGGASSAQLKSYNEAYQASVFNYKATVLAAFQEVEDQLSSINSLKKQVEVLSKSTENYLLLLKIAQNQYKSGIVDYSQVLTNQINYYNARKTLNDTISLKRTAEITLIKALGGGWKNNLEE